MRHRLTAPTFAPLTSVVIREVGSFGDKRPQRENFGPQPACRSAELCARRPVFIGDFYALTSRQRIFGVVQLAEAARHDEPAQWPSGDCAIASAPERGRSVEKAIVIDLLDEKIRHFFFSTLILPFSSFFYYFLLTIFHSSFLLLMMLSCTSLSLTLPRNKQGLYCIDSPQPLLSLAPRLVTQIKLLTPVASIARTRTRLAAENRRVLRSITPARASHPVSKSLYRHRPAPARSCPCRWHRHPFSQA